MKVRFKRVSKDRPILRPQMRQQEPECLCGLAESLLLRQWQPIGLHKNFMVSGGNARVRVDQGAERRKAGRRLPVAALPMPTIAALHWACLGGGLEFALACDYRLVFDKPNTQLGLGESITK